MPRHFRLDQAEALLAEVERLLREAIDLKDQYQASEQELKQLTQRITMLGGALIDRRELGALKSRRDNAAVALKETIERLYSIGCEVKDLETGLVDFRTWYRGEEVYLCWRLGESGIRFWHGLTEGFRGRKEIDQDFLENHLGDLSQ